MQQTITLRVPNISRHKLRTWAWLRLGLWGKSWQNIWNLRCATRNWIALCLWEYSRFGEKCFVQSEDVSNKCLGRTVASMFAWKHPNWIQGRAQMPRVSRNFPQSICLVLLSSWPLFLSVLHFTGHCLNNTLPLMISFLLYHSSHQNHKKYTYTVYCSPE